MCKADEALSPCLLGSLLTVFSGVLGCQVTPLAPPAPMAVDDHNPDITYWSLPVRQPEGSIVHTPEQCGVCHRPQYADWKTSVHAQANSVGLRGQMVAMKPGPAMGCALCHKPLSVQLPFREIGDSGRLRRKHAHGEQSLVEEKIAAYYSGEVQLVPNPELDPNHAKYGLTCAGCHMRMGRIHAPPSGQTPPEISAERPAPHGEPIRLPYFESAEFCAECHQFTQRNNAGNKPLENTYVEWKNSLWAESGTTCVDCHMPKRRHLWKGIHSPDMVQAALRVEVNAEVGDHRATITLTLENTGAGHAMPTYVTPHMIAHLQALDENGTVLAETEYLVARVVESSPWRELSDTRLMSMRPVTVELEVPREGVASVRRWVHVKPDHFYTGVFERILARGGSPEGYDLIREAKDLTLKSDYVIHDETEPFEDLL